MNTPICDFVDQYLNRSPLRLHMPGHKGSGPLGAEARDITEIEGADVLYHENGILKSSQQNAATLFESKKTLYSTEGATLCIRAMLVLGLLFAKKQKKPFSIAAARNAHKSFLTGCALLHIDPIWIDTENHRQLLSAPITSDDLRYFFENQEELPTAVYVTSPDYLGRIADVFDLAKICHEYGALLFVDNAHGAYLQFLKESCHPLALGADLVCDSAHKTLPVLTGGAYLHISSHAPNLFTEQAENAMALLASTSPSYLILQSLDACNAYLSDHYSERLHSFSSDVFNFKKELRKMGFSLIGDEPLKVTIQSKSYGYRGNELASLLADHGIIVEFSDPDYLVMMLTPEIGLKGIQEIKTVLEKLPKKEPILSFPPMIPMSEKVLSPTEALFSPSVLLPLNECIGKVLAQPGVTCPPAVPIAICGERITEEHITAFQYYQIKFLSVIP